VRIVVVDPSRTVLKAVSQLLESDGHLVTAFVDAKDALDFIKSDHEVSVLLTSVELASMSGMELCWETRLLSGQERAIYIILMSSNSDQQHLVNALDSGADEFIRKPPAGEELYARLRSAERLLRLQNELIRLASVDPLTGVFNRRAFFEKAQQSHKSATPSAAIMFDVDHFKRVNDTYGHDAGDQVLRAIGREALSHNGIVGRLGGEEFAVLLEGAKLEAAVEQAECLRARFAELSFDTDRGAMSVTCSFGVAEGQHGESVDRLLKSADTALYRAKESGRNRVIAASVESDARDAQWSRLLRAARRRAVEEPSVAETPSPSKEPLAEWSNSLEDKVPTASENAASLAAGRAFVLDDEAHVATIVCKVLEACGFAAHQFTSMPPFLTGLKNFPPDLLVLDLSLGQSDAVEVIRHLEVGKYQGKVLLISGRDEATLNEITEIGSKHGLAMLAPLKKPFRPTDLKQRLLQGQTVNGRPALSQDSQPNEASSEKAAVQFIEALQNGWLEIWYQPKFDLKTFAICGAEGLIRARHPQQGILLPENLLPPSGDSNYAPLTKFAIGRTVADWKRFSQTGILLKLSVNAPVSVIGAPAFVTFLQDTLPKHPSFPGLTIEVTEDELVRDSEWAHEVASQLKLYNIDLSIDDFGSGYSSLLRLNDLPCAEVKIDRSFASGCASNKVKHGLCQTVVDLAHRFGAKVCAEGVETTDDLCALAAMQCDSAQGFLLAKPMPAAHLAALLSTWSGQSLRTLLQEQERRLAQSA
jgi:two-component system cell cycle response regulator